MNSKTKKLLALSLIKGVGEKTLKEYAENPELLEKSLEDIVHLSLRRKLKGRVENIQCVLEQADFQCKTADSLGHKIVSVFDKDYPESLRILESAPQILFCAGNLKALEKKTVAIIGTREPTDIGKVIAKRVTDWYSARGWVVVSGLADGVDTIAHKSCIANSGKTVAVLAQGIDYEKIYPASNKELAKDIVAKGGVLISEYPYGQRVSKAALIKRDSVQAALSTGVVLVQTGEKGGSLHASRASLKFGRPLIVVGQSNRDVIHNESKIRGNLKLIGNKAAVREVIGFDKFDNDLIFNMKNNGYLEESERLLLKNSWWDNNYSDSKKLL